MATTMSRPLPFTCLPRERYVSDTWFEREMDEIFLRQWIYFGHVSQLPGAGSILVREIGDESIVATRDEDGAIHAFFNVCRHRGFRLCDAGKGQAKRISCPYHQWTYNLDGSLKAAPTMTDGEMFDFGDYGLRPVHLQVWRGFIFVALGEQPPAESLDEGLAGADPHVDVFQPEQLKVVHETRHDVACNWKVLNENYHECYHCSGSHPELCAVSDLPKIYDVDAATAEGMGEFGWGSALPLRPGVETFSISGNAVSKKPLGSAPPGLEPFSIGIHPTLTSIVFSFDHVVMHQLLPISAQRSCWVTQWLVHPDAVEGVDYEVQELAAIWDATNLEDIALCERNQLGVRSRSFVAGPNSPTREPGIRSLLATYYRMLGETDQYERLTGVSL